MGGDAGGEAGVGGVNGEGVGCLVWVCVLGCHLGKSEGESIGGGYWGADQAAMRVVELFSRGWVL